MKKILCATLLLTAPLVCHADWTQSCREEFITIAAVGDVLLHRPLQIRAANAGFKTLWSDAMDILQSADITYANIEGPMAEGVTRSGWIMNDADQRNPEVYSSYPLFNYPPSLATALKESGVDIVSTANNHTLDRFGVGVDKTIETLNKSGLTYVGTRPSDSKNKFYQIISAKGFRLAWIACTQDTNGIEDKNGQVLYCYKKRDKKLILKSISHLKNKVDGIIVSPHWGTQYTHQPNALQKQFAKQLLEAGATAIIGSHPHVVQPVQNYITQDGRQTLVAYSLGNFVSFQGTPKNRSTIILNFALEKGHHGKLETCAVRYQPAYMMNRSGQSRIALKLLSSNDRQHIGYKILQSILEDEHFHD